MMRKPIAVAGFSLLICSTLVMAQDVAASGAPEIIKVMDLDGLTVAGKPGVENNYKYLREPNAVVTPGWTFGYNALVALPNGEIGLVFEGSPSGVERIKAKRDHNTGARLGIDLVKFSLDWLLAQKTSPISAATERTRPNILCIMVDDMGYSDVGCYGGEIDTPNIDKLADNGLRFSQFYNCGRCCPTRASLLTGLYPHKAGLGFMTARDYGKPGYRAELNRNCVTLAEALKLGGYRTYMAGKWHVCKDFAANGPKHNWPLQRGFDRFFGTLIAAGSQWNPMTLTEGNKPVMPQGDFFYTEAISRKAVEYIESHAAADPFFLYVAHTAPHWPLHARSNVIEKYRGRFAEGWDVLRRRRLDRLVQAGILSRDLVLSERGQGIPSWKEAPHKQWEQSRMEAYAAMVDHVDQGVGDIVQALKQKGLLENTLIFFLSDNGGDSLEHPDGRIGSTGKPWAYMRYVPLYTRDGRPVIAGDYPGLKLGPDQTYGGYGTKWANLSNTPFRYYKKYAHEGGVSTPLIVPWPAGIKGRGELRHQPAHVIDLMATSLEVAGAAYPEHYRNEPIKPLDGKSLLPVFTRDTAIHEALFFEHHGNRAVRKGKWKIVAIEEGPWALYDMERDRTETTDLADRHPKVARELAIAYDGWAERSHVLPVDALKIEEIPGAENPLTRPPVEMNRFLKTVNQELRRRDLPLFEVNE
jgi:arylsulfatase A-like enzyme